ncbi:hypothetical protein HDU91_003565, partial [Kappamyces sp. JEL0680]
VRELNEFEQTPWEFWTSSPAFHLSAPKTRGVVSVPVGEAWVVERLGSFSRVLPEGRAVLLPFVESVKAVKNTTLQSMGFISTDIQSKDGASVDAYATALYRVTDAKTSAYYIDAETNKPDSERSAAKSLRKALAQAIAETNVGTGLTAAAKKDIAAKLLAKIKATEASLGLCFELVEVHWADVLTPPFFQKVTHGSKRVPVTPMTPSMEWNVPSPPDFHHFNMQPKLAVAPEAEELKKLGHSH